MSTSASNRSRPAGRFRSVCSELNGIGAASRARDRSEPRKALASAFHKSILQKRNRRFCGASHRSPGFAELPSGSLACAKRRRQADHVLRLSRELDREILIGPDEAPKPEINQTPRINQVSYRPPTVARRFLCDSADRLIVIHRREFGLLRNRPDASLLLRARWIAQTRWCFGTANKRRIP